MACHAICIPKRSFSTNRALNHMNYPDIIYRRKNPVFAKTALPDFLVSTTKSTDHANRRSSFFRSFSQKCEKLIAAIRNAEMNKTNRTRAIRMRVHIIHTSGPCFVDCPDRRQELRNKLRENTSDSLEIAITVTMT